MPGSSFSTHSDHITVAGIGNLSTRDPLSQRVPGYKKKSVGLVEKQQGWSAYVTMERPKPKKRVASKKGQKLYNSAAIFVTDKVTPRKVSGGLPSLGKRK